MAGRVQPSSPRAASRLEVVGLGDGDIELRDGPPAHVYLRFFPAHEIDAIARVVDEMRSHKEALIEQWQSLYAASFKGHHYAEPAFQDAYVPYLRSGVLRLAAGDPEGYVRFSALLG